MNYLIDTHILIWALEEPEKLPKVTEKVLADYSNDIFVSILSLWEISMKFTDKMKNATASKMQARIDKLGFKVLQLSINDAVTYSVSPSFENHKDPFDKMIINQAINRQLPLNSMDRNFEQYRSHGLILANF
jgi:PIN domain nuclease of toxin-antitoxin system